MADDEELEYTLLNKREVLVYQIPPASSSSGHKADDWKKCIWRGRCRIVGKGSDLSIKMIDATSGQLFAQCAIPGGDSEKYVERVIDSSRYFVLKITNGARHAFIGLGFEDRNDAFDFNCTLADFKSTWVDRDKQVEELPKSNEPTKDLSLKEGQKITISLAGVGGRKREAKAELTGGGGGFSGLLAPPPSSGQSRRQAAAGAPTSEPLGGASALPTMVAPVPAGAQAQDDFFGDFDDFQGAAGSTAAFGAPTPAAAPVGGGSSVALDGMLGQLHLGAPGPAMAQPAAQPLMLAEQGGFDIFSGLGASAPTSHASKQQEVLVQRKVGGNDPFDEFDIFK